MNFSTQNSKLKTQNFEFVVAFVEEHWLLSGVICTLKTLLR